MTDEASAAMVETAKDAAVQRLLPRFAQPLGWVPVADFRDAIRAAIEAATPFIEARVLEEAALLADDQANIVPDVDAYRAESVHRGFADLARAIRNLAQKDRA